MQKVRSHLVNFRVTEEEFEQLKNACDRQGARCLSHFVRDVVFQTSNLNTESVVTQVSNLDRRVAALENRFPSNEPALNNQEVSPCV
jgi:hypothetical protein